MALDRDRPSDSRGAPVVRSRARAARDRAAARGDLPPLRLRFSLVRVRVDSASPVAADRGRRTDDVSALQDRAAPRAGDDGAGAARPLDQRHGDVPRPDVLPGVPTEGRAAPANVSVHPDLARGVLDRRRGLLDGHSPRGGGAVRARAHLCDRHQRSRRAPRARRHLPARADAGVHRELHQGRGHAIVLGVLRRRSTMARSSRQRCSATSCSRSTTSSPIGRSRSSTSSCVATCSSTSTATSRCACTDSFTSRSCISEFCVSGRRRRCGSRTTRTRTRSFASAERIYRKVR